MIQVKPGVRLSEAVAMALLLQVAEDVFASVGASITTITSGVDSHTTGLHPKGRALDFRTRDVQALLGESRNVVVERIVQEMQRRLGEDFDVINEHVERLHIHAEWDPKWLHE